MEPTNEVLRENAVSALQAWIFHNADLAAAKCAGMDFDDREAVESLLADGMQFVEDVNNAVSEAFVRNVEHSKEVALDRAVERELSDPDTWDLTSVPLETQGKVVEAPGDEPK